MRPRRKRLLMVLAAVLALSAGFWWMTRPVIDPRLVGTWEKKVALRGGAPTHNFLRFRLVFRNDGSGELHSSAANGFQLARRFAWKMSDGSLVQLYEVDSLQSRLRQVWEDVFRSKSLSVTRIEVKFNGPDSLDLQKSENGKLDIQRLVRVPD